MAHPKAVIFALGAAVIAIGAVEGGARLLEPHAKALRGPYRVWDLPAELEFAPGAALGFAGGDARANPGGYQGPYYPAERTPGSYRVVLLGDSMASAWQVRPEESWPVLLERRLNAGLVEVPATPASGSTPAALRPRVEILNFAWPGYNTHLEALAYTHRAAKYGPDHVLVAYYPNDAMNDRFVPNIYRYCPVPPPVWERLADAAIASFAVLRMAHDFALLFAAGYPGVREGHIRLMDPDWYGFQCSMHWLQSLRAETHKGGVKFGVIQLPYLGDAGFPDAPERAAQAALAARLRALGIPAVNLYPDFAQYTVKPMLLPDTHPNAYGHRMYAKVIARRAAELGLPAPRPEAAHPSDEEEAY